MTAAEAVRAARQASNAALENGDLSAFMASIESDYVGTAGNGGHVRSRGELRKLIRGVFAAPAHPYFVRTTEEITVATSGSRAVETGCWTGYERSSDGTAKVTDQGHYTAYWKAAGGRWVIRAELFVTLD